MREREESAGVLLVYQVNESKTLVGVIVPACVWLLFTLLYSRL